VHGRDQKKTVEAGAPTASENRNRFLTGHQAHYAKAEWNHYR
jgi:hypothetical protein